MLRATGPRGEPGIAYVFLGAELGGRGPSEAFYENGVVQYDRMAARPEFCAGLDRLRRGLRTHRIVLMCAEGDPIACHRFLTVCRRLRGSGVEIRHVHSHGGVELHVELEERQVSITAERQKAVFRVEVSGDGRDRACDGQSSCTGHRSTQHWRIEQV